MSRVTAPIAKLSRSLNSAVHTASRLEGSSHNAGAVLMPKYAELLRNRRTPEQSDSSRGLTTAHRPTPQPSLANRSKPLMQTFTTAATTTSAPHGLDAAVLPSWDALFSPPAAPSGPRVPILPDNFLVQNPLESESATPDFPAVTIVAVNPDNVLSSTPLSQVQGLDSVSLGFAHESSPAAAAKEPEAHEGGMVSDIWKGMVEDVMGAPGKKA